jgi:dihydrofolate reductase
MGTIVVSENVSLDGVVEDPTGEEGFPHGGWFDAMTDRDREAWARIECAEAMGAAALLLGRRNDAYFGPRWSSRTGEWADRLNGLPKYVVSSTLTEPAWTNATVLKGDVATEVSELKRALPGEIVVYASRRLVHTLLKHDLVDELRLMTFPVVLGAGRRLFADLGDSGPCASSARAPWATASPISGTSSSGRCRAGRGWAPGSEGRAPRRD